MATKTKSARKRPNKTGKAQFERFVEAARKAEVDEDAEALDRAFEKIAPRKAPSRATDE
jgi:hypothetical protein